MTLAACQTDSREQKLWPVEPLTAGEFSYYADNANAFADSVLESGAKFLYVQLACPADRALTEEETTAAEHNADGICAMIANDYHDALDARTSTDDVTEAIEKKLQLSDHADILVIGDAAGKTQVYEELAKKHGNAEYKSATDVTDDDYDAIYSYATEAGFDAVIVANDTAAFHAQSFPFSAES